MSSYALRGLSRDSVWDYENGFYWFSHKTRLSKAIAQYEIYKSILDLPGSVFEFGVFKGASLIRIATYRDLLENDYSRKIVGFDAFGEFPTENLCSEEDLNFVKEFETVSGDGLSDDELAKVLVEKGIQNLDLVKGNVFDSLPKYLHENPAEQVSLLHVDLDVKEPTEFVLQLLYDRIVPGGIIVFDDYGTVNGETLAANQFLEKFGLNISKKASPCCPAFVVKPG